MGRYAKKCKGSGEVAAETPARKRKIAVGESEPPSTSLQLKTRRLSDDSAPAETSNDSTSCESAASGQVSASCCSSSGSNELAKESCNSADLEENAEVRSLELIATSAGDSVDFEERRGMATTSSIVQAELGELESETRPRLESNSRPCSKVEKMPSESELEEFFAAAEMNLQKQFIDKYNYDIVKGEPLEGRYEWVEVQLKP